MKIKGAILLTLAVVVLAAVMIITRILAGKKSYTVSVEGVGSYFDKTYRGFTNAVTLKDLFDEMSAKGNFSYTLKYGGTEIYTINGLEVTDADMVWTIKINGESVSDLNYEIHDKDKIVITCHIHSNGLA